MNAVLPIEATVKPTIDNACHWLTQKGERGELPATTARFKVTAIRQLTGILADDEPRDDARWVLENVDAIAKRWATKHAGKYGADTIKTYSSRARSGLEDYLKWLDDPTGFRFTRERDPAKPAKPRDAKPSKVEATDDVEAPRASAGGQPPPPSNVRTFPLPGGRVFRFELPEGDLTVDDVRRMGLHLVTFACDMNPAAPTDPFAMARRPE